LIHNGFAHPLAPQAFEFLALMSLVQGLFTMFFLPETKNKQLE